MKPSMSLWLLYLDVLFELVLQDLHEPADQHLHLLPERFHLTGTGALVVLHVLSAGGNRAGHGGLNNDL